MLHKEIASCGLDLQLLELSHSSQPFMVFVRRIVRVLIEFKRHLGEAIQGLRLAVVAHVNEEPQVSRCRFPILHQVILVFDFFYIAMRAITFRYFGKLLIQPSLRLGNQRDLPLDVRGVLLNVQQWHHLIILVAKEAVGHSIVGLVDVFGDLLQDPRAPYDAQVVPHPLAALQDQDIVPRDWLITLQKSINLLYWLV